MKCQPDRQGPLSHIARQRQKSDELSAAIFPGNSHHIGKADIPAAALSDVDPLDSGQNQTRRN
jgi:hypothetical protein